MGSYTPDEILDLIVDQYMLADEEAVCSSQPTTYFNACWPDLWVAETPYAEGALVRPPTDNGYVYEVPAGGGGTSGVSEPPWGTVQDAEFADGTVTWKTHENYALINAALDVGDKVKADGDTDGRKITVAQKMGITIHTDGTVGHTALIDNVNKKLKFVATAATSLEGDNNVVSGRTTLLHEMTIVVRDPAVVA
jgi:hypothetical protein